VPVYAYECPKCGWKTETFRKIRYRNSATGCRCGFTMNRTIERANVNPDYEPYLDPNLIPAGAGADFHQPVKSRGHRRELMKRLGLQEIG
jgi:hypothetical protein